MDIPLFFGVPIVMINDVVDAEYNNTIVNRLDEIQQANPESRHNWLCEIYTTHNMWDLQQDNTFDHLLNEQSKLVAEYVGEIVSDNTKKVGLINSWFNVSEKHSYQEQHIHTNSHVSVVYYAKAPEGSAPTIFRSPYTEQNTFGNSLTNDIIVPPVERSAVLFLSFTPHLTGQHQLDETRITVASNYSVIGENDGLPHHHQ